MNEPVETPETLSFLVSEEPEDTSQTMGLFRRGEREVTTHDISTAALARNIKASVARLREVFSSVRDDAGPGMRISQVQVQFEVTAKGGINFIGTTEVGSKGAITLVFDL